MSPKEDEILHVSDTALMVAACRAMETARPDGLVRDPFAERLAGARGMAIARGIPGLDMMCFGVGIRNRFLDELLMNAVTAHPVETVVSVGAGLDSRPWLRICRIGVSISMTYWRASGLEAIYLAALSEAADTGARSTAVI